MNVIAKMNSRELVIDQSGADLSEQFYLGAGNSGHKMINIPSETVIERSCVTGRMAYYVLSSILTIGILMLLLIPIGSTFLYIDYKQQLAQRKSNKNDLCKSKCSFGAECIMDEYTSQPFCRCPLVCADDYEPVCGSDGTTYVNLCHLRYESCNKQQTITLVANSACDANLCDNVTCHRYQKCQVDDKGKAQCVCVTTSNCDSQGQPVCGSNNKLYGSLCELQKHSCLHKLDIVPTNLESCLEKGSLEKRLDDTDQEKHQLKAGGPVKCGLHVCSPYAQCNTSGIVHICHCPEDCSQQENEASVCGTNNRNYANECELRREACLRQVELKVLHHGQCGRCSQQCEHYAECKANEQGVPECVCPQVCIRVDRPVCGDNGVTYENQCELQVASCRLQRQINVRFNASCDLCHNVVCPYGATCLDGECVCTDNCQNNAAEPLCANDGNTYRNECEMSRVACASRKELIALFYGECEETKEKYLDDSSQPIGNSESQSETLMPLQLAQSECHQSYQFCKETKPEHDHLYICENRIFHSKCEMIEFKCRNANSKHKCSKYCQCNPHGTKTNSHLCNPSTGQCDCKEGISGLRCDKCSNKFWDFQQVIDNPYSSGCKPCKCNKIGSINEECDRLNGTCRCKHGVKGPKCDQCRHNRQFTSRGCVVNSVDTANLCHNHKCHFGGVCRQNGTHVECSCQLNCSQHNRQTAPICASDGSIHSSMCHFREHVCRLQKKLHIVKHCAHGV